MRKNKRVTKILEEINSISEKYPTAIFPVGIAGSGKSYLINEKNLPTFITFNADEKRLEKIKSLKKNNRKLLVNGKKTLANPKKTSHVFHESLREWIFQYGLREVEKLAKRKNNLIIDQTNLHLQRVYFFNLLRKYNYKIVVIKFKPRSLEIHNKNILKRVKKGGLDIVPEYISKKKPVRLAIIKELKILLDCFSKNIKVNRKQKSTSIRLLKIEKLKTRQPTIRKYLSSLERKNRKIAQKLLKLDRVDYIYII